MTTESSILSSPCLKCYTSHSLVEAQEKTLKKGLALAICGDDIFQVIECCKPGCAGKVIFHSQINNPAIDMSCLLLSPIFYPKPNSDEQSWIFDNWDNWHDYLKFDFIPAWDSSKINANYFINTNINDSNLIDELFDDELIDALDYSEIFDANNEHEEFLPNEPDNFVAPLCLTVDEFQNRLGENKLFVNIKLRCLVPDTQKFRKLLTLLSPYKIRVIYESGESYADGNESKDPEERKRIWKSLIQETKGKTLEDSIRDRLASKGFDSPEPSEINNIVDNKLRNKSFTLRMTLWEIVSKYGFENEQLGIFLKNSFDSIFYSICTEIALSPKRQELMSWADKVEPGKALFIDAPMGLGKTRSIVEALATKRDLSAIIFMPTKRLCQEITESLKERIHSLNIKKGIAPLFFNVNEGKEPVKDKNNKYIYDEDGLILHKYKKDFLKNEVYYAEGINKDECPHFDEIMKNYRLYMFKKSNICHQCIKKNDCRFLKYHVGDKDPYEALFSRIIVATHHQYDHFYHYKESHNWYIKIKEEPEDGSENEQKEIIDKKQRNMFIIDEDLIFSQLYQPYSINLSNEPINFNQINLDQENFSHKNSLISFIGVIVFFLQRQENTAEMRKDIETLYSRIKQCDKTSIIQAINPEFKFPKYLFDEWETTFTNQKSIIPDYIEWTGLIGNYLEIVIHAIRFGAVVEKWGNRYTVHFPNPRSYNLSKVPPHVFFDGTMLDEIFLEKKLSGVKFELHKIEINNLWNINVHQNTNSDLPAYKIYIDYQNVYKFLTHVLSSIPIEKKVLILTKKKINLYLKSLVETEFHNRRIETGYFGNLRGLNNAKNCTVGIMLGSFTLSDSVEVAMALEFIKPESLKRDITLIKNHLWEWSEPYRVRTYKEEFSVIGKMAKAYQRSEHRQALARTRYLFHDVDFYIISKDPVSEYEPFFNNILDTQYKAELFPLQPQRAERPEKKVKYDEVKQKVIEWFDNDFEKTVIAKQIHEEYGIRRQTVSKKLKEMFAEGFLSKVKNKKTTYMLSKKDKYGHDTLLNCIEKSVQIHNDQHNPTTPPPQASLQDSSNQE